MKDTRHKFLKIFDALEKFNTDKLLLNLYTLNSGYTYPPVTEIDREIKINLLHDICFHAQLFPKSRSSKLTLFLLINTEIFNFILDLCFNVDKFYSKNELVDIDYRLNTIWSFISDNKYFEFLIQFWKLAMNENFNQILEILDSLGEVKFMFVNRFIKLLCAHKPNKKLKSLVELLS